MTSHTYRLNIDSLMVSTGAIYSASVVKSVTYCCVLEKQHTRLQTFDNPTGNWSPVSGFAGIVCVYLQALPAQARYRSGTYCRKYSQKEHALNKSHDCPPMYLSRLIRVPHYRPLRFRNIPSCLVCKPHEAPHYVEKGPSTHVFFLVPPRASHQPNAGFSPRHIINLAVAFSA